MRHVEGETTHAELAGWGVGRRIGQPTLPHLDAGQQLVHAERLGDIIVGTQAEALQNIVLLLLGRQDDDGHHRLYGLDLLQQSEAIHHRHHHIGDT